MPFPDNFSVDSDWRLLVYVSLNGAWTPLRLSVFDLIQIWMLFTQGVFVFLWIMSALSDEFYETMLGWVHLSGCFGGFKENTPAVPLVAPGFLMNLLPLLVMPLLLNFITKNIGIFSLRTSLHNCALHEKSRLHHYYEKFLAQIRCLCCRNAGFAPVQGSENHDLPPDLDNPIAPLVNGAEIGEADCCRCWLKCCKCIPLLAKWFCLLILSLFLLLILPVFEMGYLIYVPLKISVDWMKPRCCHYQQQQVIDATPNRDGSSTNSGPAHSEQPRTEDVILNMDGAIHTSLTRNGPQSTDVAVPRGAGSTTPDGSRQDSRQSIVVTDPTAHGSASVHSPPSIGHHDASEVVANADESPMTSSSAHFEQQVTGDVVLSIDGNSLQSASPHREIIRGRSISDDEAADFNSRCRHQFLQGVWRWYYLVILIQFTTAVVLGAFHCNRGPKRSGASTPLYILMQYAWNGPLFASLVVYTTITEAMLAVCASFSLFEDHHKLDSEEATSNFKRSGIEIRHLSMETIWRYDKLLTRVNRISEGSAHFGWVILVQLLVAGGAIIFDCYQLVGK